MNILSQNSLKKNEIGRYATLDVPTTTPKLTISQIREKIFNKINDYETINYVYVVKNNKLKGVFSIKELVRAKPSQAATEVMIKNLVAVRAHTYRERAVNLALEHSLKALPVVDKNNNFLGVVPSDDLLEILHQEWRDYFLQSAGMLVSGTTVDNTLTMSIFKSFWHRAPWIVIGLFGGIFAARIVDGFETTLEANLILAAFIPLIVYISDAVGTQTQTLLVRDLALQPNLPLIKYTLKQTLIATLLALLCGGIVALVVSIAWEASYMSFVIGVSTFAAIVSSTFIAISIPYLLYKLKQDPATGSGPFATIIQDLTSIIIYFAIATALVV